MFVCTFMCSVLLLLCTIILLLYFTLVKCLYILSYTMSFFKCVLLYAIILELAGTLVNNYNCLSVCIYSCTVQCLSTNLFSVLLEQFKWLLENQYQKNNSHQSQFPGITCGLLKAREKFKGRCDWFWFFCSLVEKLVQDFLANHSAQQSQLCNYFQQLFVIVFIVSCEECFINDACCQELLVAMVM